MYELSQLRAAWPGARLRRVTFYEPRRDVAELWLRLQPAMTKPRIRVIRNTPETAE